jgi:hypothetical protein
MLASGLLAQSADSTTRISTHQVSRNAFKSDLQPWEGIDTGIDLIHQFNPVYQLGNHQTNLGSYGSPVFSRNFQPFKKAVFRTGLNAYDPYTYKPGTLPFYDTYTPYTDLDYSQSANGELQDLEGVYSRNISPFWNAAIRFNSMRTTGGYLSQLNKMNNIALNTRFQSQNGRYRGFLSGIWNNLRNKQNGGIADIEEFKNPETDNRSRLTVNLEEAFSRYKTQDYTYDQYLYLGKEQVDTVYQKQDTFIKKSIASPLQVHHQFSYRQMGYSYQDQNLQETDSFYQAIRQDSSITYDSMRFSRIRNAFTIGNFQSPDSTVGSIRYKAGAAWHLFKVEQGVYGNDTTFNENSQRFQQVLLKGRVAMDLGRFRLQARGKFFPAGRYQGDLKARGNLNLSIDSFQSASMGYRFQRRQPDFLFGTMESNHLNWDVTLKKPVLNRVYGIYRNKSVNLEAKVAYTLMNNYTYYDQTLEPSQEETPLNTVSGDVKHRFELSPFYWENHLRVQAFSKPDLIRLPKWQVKSSLYYKNWLFDSNLLFSAGLDFRYSQAHEGKAYQPNYNLRYLQDQQSIAGYPVFDAHVNFKIGRFRGFLRMAHLNKGLAGHDYFGLPGYPIHPRMFTIGIKWTFFN